MKANVNVVFRHVLLLMGGVLSPPPQLPSRFPQPVISGARKHLFNLWAMQFTVDFNQENHSLSCTSRPGIKRVSVVPAELFTKKRTPRFIENVHTPEKTMGIIRYLAPEWASSSQQTNHLTLCSLPPPNGDIIRSLTNLVCSLGLIVHNLVEPAAQQLLIHGVGPQDGPPVSSGLYSGNSRQMRYPEPGLTSSFMRLAQAGRSSGGIAQRNY